MLIFSVFMINYKIRKINPSQLQEGFHILHSLTLCLADDSGWGAATPMGRCTNLDAEVNLTPYTFMDTLQTQEYTLNSYII